MVYKFKRSPFILGFLSLIWLFPQGLCSHSPEDPEIKVALEKIEDTETRKLAWDVTETLAKEKNWDVWEAAEMVETFAVVPPKRHEAVLTVTSLLKLKNWTQTDYVTAIPTLQNLQIHLDMDSFGRLAKVLDSKKDDTRTYTDVLSVLFSVPQTEDILKCMEDFTVDPTWIARDYYHIAEAFRQVPPEKLETCRLTLKHLDKPEGFWFSNNYVSVIKALADVPMARFFKVCSKLLYLTKGSGWSSGSYPHLIQALSKIPIRRIKKVLATTAKLVEGKEEWNIGDVYATLIDGLADVPQGQEERVIDLATQLAQGKNWGGSEKAKQTHFPGEDNLRLKPQELVEKYNGLGLASLIKAIANCPEAKLQKILGSLDQCQGMRGGTMTLLINILTYVSDERLAEIAKTILTHVNDSMRYTEDYAVEQLELISPMCMEVALDECLKYINTKNMWRKQDLILLIAALENVPAVNIGPVLRAAEKLTQYDASQEGNVNIIKALGKVPVKHMDAVLKATARIPNDAEWHEAITLAFIEALAPLSIERMKGIFERIDELYPHKNMSLEVQALFVSVLGPVHETELNPISQALKGFVQGKQWRHEYLEYIIKSFKDVPISRLDAVIKAITKLSQNKELDGEGCGQFITALSKVPLQRFDAVVRAAEKHDKGKIWVELKGNRTIETLAQLPTGRLDAIMKVLDEIIQENKLTSTDRTFVLKGITKVPSQYFKPIGTALVGLTRGNSFHFRQKEDMLAALNNIPASHRVAVIDGTTKLVAGTCKDGTHQINIIKAFSNVHPQAIEAVINASEMLSNRKAGFRHAPIIGALADASHSLKNALHRIKTITDAALRIGKASGTWNLNGTDLAFIIEGLTSVPPGRIDAVCEMTARLAEPKCLQRTDLKMIIKALAEVPFERFEALEKTVFRMASDTGWKGPQFEGFIRILTYVPVDLMDSMADEVYRILVKGDVTAIVKALPYIPESQIPGFIRAASSVNVRSFQAQYNDLDFILTCHAVAMGTAGDVHRDQLFAHWKPILQSFDKVRATQLVKVITDALRFAVIDEMHDLAVRVGTVLNENLADSPYNIHERLLAKKGETVNWEAIPLQQKVVENCNLRLQHKAVWEFSQTMTPDYSQVPYLRCADLNGLLNGLNDRLEDQGFAGNFGYENLRLLVSNALAPTSYFQRLISSPIGTKMGAYLRYIVQFYKNMENTDEKWAALGGLLVSARHCDVGHGTAIEEVYFTLPPSYRLPFKGDEQKYTLKSWKALETVHQAIQRVSLETLSHGSLFTKRACGLQEKDEVIQGSHQAYVLRGLMGTFVGYPSELEFDLNARHIYEPILHSSLHQLVAAYWEGVDLEQMIDILHKQVNETIKASKDEELYPHFVTVFKTDIEDSVERDEEDGFQGVTRKGMIRLLKHVKILEEVDGPLPW